jgi:hypothetical protein
VDGERFLGYVSLQPKHLSSYLIIMNQISFSERIKVPLPVIIVSLFIVLSFCSCGGGGGGSSTSINSPGNSATLTWDAPTTNADGTPLTDLAGYNLYYGTSSGNYTVTIDVGNVTTYGIDGFPPGTYYFVLTAYDISGNESDYSTEISRTIQ